MDKAVNNLHGKQRACRVDAPVGQSWPEEAFDWSVVLPTMAGLLLGLTLDGINPEAFGVWTLMLSLLGLVLGEAYSSLNGGSVYRK